MRYVGVASLWLGREQPTAAFSRRHDGRQNYRSNKSHTFFRLGMSSFMGNIRRLNAAGAFLETPLHGFYPQHRRDWETQPRWSCHSLMAATRPPGREDLAPTHKKTGAPHGAPVALFKCGERFLFSEPFWLYKMANGTIPSHTADRWPLAHRRARPHQPAQSSSPHTASSARTPMES